MVIAAIINAGTHPIIDVSTQDKNILTTPKL